MAAEGSLVPGHLATQTYADWVILRAPDSDQRRDPLHSPQDTPKLHFVTFFFNPLKTALDVHFNLGFIVRKLLYEPYSATTGPVLLYVWFCFQN